MRPYSLIIIVCLLSSLGCANTRPDLSRHPTGVIFVRLAGGDFEMGDTFDRKNQDALPSRLIHVEPFYLSTYETSFAQYDIFARATGHPLPAPDLVKRGDRAAGDISWEDAVAYCSWLGGRLPTEEEWEFAAAGGERKQRFAGTDRIDEADTLFRHLPNAHGTSGSIYEGTPNAFGFLNMSGNVAEWIGDYYESYPEPSEGPVWYDPATRQIRIVRGGGFSSSLDVLQTFWRAGTLVSVRTPTIGVRCARSSE